MSSTSQAPSESDPVTRLEDLEYYFADRLTSLSFNPMEYIQRASKV